MLQSKQVLYTAEKAEKLYTRMFAVTDENEAVSVGSFFFFTVMTDLRFS
ncbi:TPA: hypothetical protein ACIUL8_003697 [Salmonella enterica subsp. enterica serovar Reading]|uniref:Uncharacterized protein n=1 Tax=Salmonella enterica TaxID=28901 RepID=A0A759K972_SALER|nr:hypothetical protein [Salmonella enterica]EGB1029875.1 hypothetical protein [Salmonella enterica subsp. enterica serovar Reading]EGI5705418.1 hypothetical protein [Salmonella enterica subsp. enterica serovar Chester]HEC8684133.1 hypothetical protein [Salmonella enterica subsp. enterica serovar Oranienburg]HEC9414109.1 hypothetical protein [Salmonella enterica subsp. enterica serovar Poona]